ncbi:MAG: type II secretion system protein GspM [Nitrospirota bacterium]
MSFSLSNISTREKVFLLTGGALATLILLYVFLLDPIQERTQQLSRLIPQKEEDLGAFSRLQEEYFFISDQMKQIEARLPQQGQFSPLSYLEGIAKQSDVRGNIAYIRSVPTIVRAPYMEIPVEVKLEAVTLDRAIFFLDAIERSNYFLRIKRLNIRTLSSDAKKLDVVFVVASYEKI